MNGNLCSYLLGNSTSRNRDKEGDRTRNESMRITKPIEPKQRSVQFQKSNLQKAAVNPSFPKPLSVHSSTIRDPMANQLSLQRRYSETRHANAMSNDGGNFSPALKSKNDLSSVGLMVSSMTLHQRPGSRNASSPSRASRSSAPNSRNNSRAGTPERRRSSILGQGSSRRNSKQDKKSFWSGNEEFYFPNGTEDEFREEEMEWIAQAAAIDEKFYLRATSPPKVQVVLKKPPNSTS